MKIEMGESLFYSWLRHVKECQIVQTNWKVSSQWQLSNSEVLEEMMALVNEHYSEKYGYAIFKQNTSLSQLLQQGECDVLGISIQPNDTKYYAVDVAFHEAGLNYGSRGTTVMKVLEKCARTAFCLHGYLSTREAEIIFASPKINPAVLSDLMPCVEEMNKLFANNGYDFTFRVIANEEYNNLVLKPILLVSDGVADTSELFLRSYQMYKMFSDVKDTGKRTRTDTSATKADQIEYDYADEDVYQELKIGQLAQKVLGRMLCDGCASDEEIVAMQTVEYSKQHFDLQYPLLRLAIEADTPLHYYAKPIEINGKCYRMCCEWFEKKGGNNDRPYLLKWIENHKK
ncbi:MAG: hypothetical protein ACI4EF_00195 [Coprococcus sp.]